MAKKTGSPDPKASVVVAPRPAAPRGKSPRAAQGESGAAKGLRAATRAFFAPLSRKVAAGIFVLAAYAFLSIRLAHSWPRGWSILVTPGAWLSGLFAWAAYFIPFWLGALAVLFSLKGHHPRSTFILSSLSLPFLITAAFARISSQPGPFFERYPVFATVGLSSLYAGLGFLLAASLGAIAFILAKLTSWLRNSGRLPERNRAGTKPRKEASFLSRIIEKIATWLKDRKERRSKAEIRLRESEKLSGDAFDLELPELPRLDGLRLAGTKADSRETDAPPAPPIVATPIVATPIVATVSDTGQQTHATFEANGKPIEFTSVPPRSPTTAGVQPGDEAGKKALVEKLLERKKARQYSVPVDGILNTYPDGQYWVIDEKTRRNAETLKETLAEFSIEAEVTGIRKGPVITMFEILPAHGVKISKITNLSDNIALRLAASSVRIVAPIPGKHAVGIEVPNEKRSIVSLREIIEHDQFRNAKMEIPFALGKDIAGGVQFSDLTQTPHILIAGATGSGKSVCVNALILSILYRRTPEEVKLILIDPKIVELKLYNDIPHLLTPVITEPKRAFQALQFCICEMERRYSILDKAGVRDVKSYNRRVKERDLAQEKLPYIVVIIDEFADLMATTGKELEATLARLAAMSRAVGIHLVLATQRPSIDVITGLIKANIPSRIAFMVASKFDSRIIIDMVGAEKLLGRGDMLFSGVADPFPVRMQGAFVSEEEVERAVAHVKTLGEPEYIDDEIFYDEEEENAEPGLFDDGDGDPLFEKALEIVLQQGKASASYIQRRLKIGYNRSARLVELMEERGIVGPAQGSKPREVVRNPEIFQRSETARRPEASRDDMPGIV